MNRRFQPCVDSLEEKALLGALIGTPVMYGPSFPLVTVPMPNASPMAPDPPPPLSGPVGFGGGPGCIASNLGMIGDIVRGADCNVHFVNNIVKLS